MFIIAVEVLDNYVDMSQNPLLHSLVNQANSRQDPWNASDPVLFNYGSLDLFTVVDLGLRSQKWGRSLVMLRK
jgi:hypothetical protein